MKKKIFTLFAMMCCVMAVKAQVIADYVSNKGSFTFIASTAGDIAEGTVSILGTGTKGIKLGRSAKFDVLDNVVKVEAVEGESFKAGDVLSYTICINNKDTSKEGHVTFVCGTQSVETDAAPNTYDGKTDALSGKITLTEDADEILFGRTHGGTATWVTEFKVTRGEVIDDPDDPDPQPGDTPDITGMSLYYWDNFTKANLQTFADNATIQITGNLSKNIESGSLITIGNKTYASMKLSNGAQNTYVAPDGYAATKVVFFSYVNKGEKTDRPAHWKEVGGVNYDVESSGGEMMSFQNGSKPDIRTYEFSSPLRAFTFTNGGEQLCYVMAVELEESAAELVKIPAAGYATYVATSNVAVPEGVEAFIVTGVYDTYVSLQGINNVAAGTPVILKGNEGYYTLPVLEGDAVDASANMLRASNGDVSGSGIYVLANQNNVVGFYPLGADVVIPAGKAYLQVEGEAKSFLALEDVTAINNVEAASAHTSTIYNVAGQKVQNIKASGLYIVNGKKVFVK